MTSTQPRLDTDLGVELPPTRRDVSRVAATMPPASPSEAVPQTKRKKQYSCRVRGCGKRAMFSGRKCYEHGKAKDREKHRLRNRRVQQSGKNKALNRARKRLLCMMTTGGVKEKTYKETVGVDKRAFMRYVASLMAGDMTIHNYNRVWRLGFKVEPSALYTEDNPYVGFHYTNIVPVAIRKSQ